MSGGLDSFLVGMRQKQKHKTKRELNILIKIIIIVVIIYNMYEEQKKMLFLCVYLV